MKVDDSEGLARSSSEPAGRLGGVTAVYHRRRRRSESTPLHRVAVLRPFTRFLADLGAPVERGFRRAGLPFTALENPDNYVPSQRFRSFVVDMAYREGIEDFGFHVGKRYGADCADPHMVDLLRRAPSLYRGLLVTTELTNRTITGSRMGVAQSPTDGYVHFFHRPSCYTAHDGSAEQIGKFGLLTMLGVIRVFTGSLWNPIEIGLMRDRTPCESVREQFPQARIRSAQPYTYVAVPCSLLSLPPRRKKLAAIKGSAPTFAPASHDFVGSLNQILDTYVLDQDLSLANAASLCNVSPRTLQRRLREARVRYSDLLAEARFRAARRLLQDPDNKVTDIAHQLGFRDSSNFARAFRRISGVSPKAFRRAHCG